MPSILSESTLRTSGALLSGQIALSHLIEREVVEPTGYDSTTLDLLVRLDQAPENRLRAVELSRQLLMSPSHISRRIDRAEKLGLLERAVDPSDRRASQVILTDQGRQVVQEFAPRLEAVIRRVIQQNFTKQESKSLVEMLQRIESVAREPSIQDPIQ